MPYRYRDDIATADAAFEAWGETLEAMFTAAADAAMNVMVADLETIAPVTHRRLVVTAEAVDMLLFALLQELIFHKDAEQLLLRVAGVEIRRSSPPGLPMNHEKSREEPLTDSLSPTPFQSSNQNDMLRLTADAYGERLNPARHDLIVDVKAVTLHRFKVEQTVRGWEALVVLDI